MKIGVCSLTVGKVPTVDFKSGKKKKYSLKINYALKINYYI